MMMATDLAMWILLIVIVWDLPRTSFEWQSLRHKHLLTLNVSVTTLYEDTPARSMHWLTELNMDIIA